MPKKPTILKIIESFKEDSVVEFSEDEEFYRKRLVYVLETKLKKLIIGDYELYLKVKKKFPTATFSTTCNDVSIVERMIANDRNPNGDPQKVWTRYMVTELAKKAYKVAKKKKEAYNMAYAAGIIGKHNLTDREDVVKPNYEDIVPFIPEITSDVSVLGIKPMGKAELKALKAKMLKKYGLPELIEDIETIKTNGEEKEEILPK